MMKKYKTKIIAGFIIVISLVAAFFQGEEIPKNQSEYEDNIEEIIQKEETPEEIPAKASVIETKKEQEPAKEEKKEFDEDITENIKETSVSDKTENDTIKRLNCTLSVKCDTIINNKDKLNSEKLKLIPQDGIIFAEQEVTFYEGESVFNLLVREMKKNKIHLEFVNTPIYNSAYIEGIANLYEKDCGENSGWKYMVNGHSPNFGCSNYQLKEGDKVEWVYSCDLGKDVGGEYEKQ